MYYINFECGYNMYPLLRSIYYNGNMSIMYVTPQSIIIVHERIALLMRNKYVIEPVTKLSQEKR